MLCKQPNGEATLMDVSHVRAMKRRQVSKTMNVFGAKNLTSSKTVSRKIADAREEQINARHYRRR